MNNVDQGAYLYQENEKLYLMIFAKLPKSLLKKTLPLEDISDSDYFQCFFVDGIDYIGVSNKEQIVTSIKEKNMISINDDRIFTLSDQDQVISYLTFANTQLNYINTEIIKYQNSYKIFGYPLSKNQISIFLPISLLVVGVYYFKKK